MKSTLMQVDVIIGLSAGDEGKGKITHHLCKSGKYNLVLRGSGGPNAGHTIYHEGKKYVTHLVPAGIFFGIPSLIGPGCVLDLTKLFAECNMLHDAGFEVKSLLRIDHRAHIITSAHREQDAKDCEVNGIGTTKCGIGPAYRDKYERTGITFGKLIDDYYAEQADDTFDGSLVPHFAGMRVDTFDELHRAEHDIVALYEGAQGHELDIDWGDYPYVTSSHTTLAGALLNGIPHNVVDKVYGVIKAYETYVGAKKFHNHCGLTTAIQEIGDEYGATTGRRRQVDFLHIPRVIKACIINGVTDLIVNKCDGLSEAVADTQEFPYYFDGVQCNAPTLELWKQQVTAHILRDTNVASIQFSYNPHEI